MRASDIATHATGPDSIAVVTLHIPLYDMAMKFVQEHGGLQLSVVSFWSEDKHCPNTSIDTLTSNRVTLSIQV